MLPWLFFPIYFAVYIDNLPASIIKQLHNVLLTTVRVYQSIQHERDAANSPRPRRHPDSDEDDGHHLQHIPDDSSDPEDFMSIF